MSEGPGGGVTDPHPDPLPLERGKVVVVGAGPAGLATAICAAQRGLSVQVFDKQRHPIDKACGEGLLPSGLAALERMGALRHLDRNESAAFDAIVYVQQGTRAEGKLPAPGGLGVRRLALSAALKARALELGVVVHEATGIRSHEVTSAGVALQTDTGDVTADVLIGADGLHSPTRERAGLSAGVAPLRRFGLRRHVQVTPWGRAVEVHFSRGLEAYVTPAGLQRVGIAFLWEAGAVEGDVTFEALLAHFPALEAQVRGRPFDSTARGAGPLWQRVKQLVAPRLALVGDAAGYVDAITGEGMTQAFEGAEALAAVLPDVIAQGGAVQAFAPYVTHATQSFRRYARLAQSVLFASRHPLLRTVVLKTLSASPALFQTVLRVTQPAPPRAREGHLLSH